jgi:phage gp46-like protein
MTGRILAALLAALALLGGGYWWGDSAATDRAGAQALDAERTRSIGRAIADADTAQVEHKSAYDMYLISSAYQKGLTDGAATQASVVARIRSGDLRLSIPIRPAAAGSGAPTAATAAGASGCNGQARAELSDQASEFLTGLLSEADAAVLQLGKCQAIVEKQREACNREPASK